MKPAAMLLCFAATTALWSSPFLKAENPAAAAKLELVGLTVHNDGSIDGSIANRSDAAIDDIDLLVSHAWSWGGERTPGVDDPGRATHLRVAGVIPPQGSLSFSYAPVPSLPVRSDGSFTTTAAVQSFSEVQN
jgi:hypothetical protein